VSAVQLFVLQSGLVYLSEPCWMANISLLTAAPADSWDCWQGTSGKSQKNAACRRPCTVWLPVPSSRWATSLQGTTKQRQPALSSAASSYSSIVGKNLTAHWVLRKVYKQQRNSFSDRSTWSTRALLRCDPNFKNAVNGNMDYHAATEGRWASCKRAVETWAIDRE